jgi:hypothetical protein
MRVISYRNSAFLKLAIWFGTAGLAVAVATPFVLQGGASDELPARVAGLCALAGLFAFALAKTRIHGLADVVIDCGDYLEVRRGQLRENVPFAKIRSVEGKSLGIVSRLTIRLEAPTRFGEQIEFLPEEHLWASPGDLKRLAQALTARATRARVTLETDVA